MSAKIHELHVYHPQIRAEDFRSPLVRRITGRDKYVDGEKEIENSYRQSATTANSNTLLLQWVGLEEDHKKCINTYQIPVITEFATIGLACILVNINIGKEITEVTRRGDRADYWIGNREKLLEVSGVQDGEIEALCKEKSEQLLDNPFGKNGYVCVVVYNILKSRLWFYN